MDVCLSTTQSLSESETESVTPTERWGHYLRDGWISDRIPIEFQSLSTKSTQTLVDSSSQFSTYTCELQTPDEVQSLLSEDRTQRSPLSLLLPKPFILTPSRKNLTVSAEGQLVESSESTQKSTEKRPSLFDTFPVRNPSNLSTGTAQNSPNSSEKTLTWDSPETTERTRCSTLFGQQSFGTGSTQRSSIICRHSLTDSTQETLYSPDSVSSSSELTMRTGSLCPECQKALNQFRLKALYRNAKVSTAEKATQTSESLQIQDEGLNSRDLWQKVLHEQNLNQHKPVHSVTVLTEDTFYPTSESQESSKIESGKENLENLPRTSTNKLWVNYIRYLCQSDYRLKTDPRYESEIVRNFQDFLRQPLDLSPTELAVCQRKFGGSYTFDQVTSFLNQIQHGEEWMMMIGGRNRKEGTCDQRSQGDFVRAQTDTPVVNRMSNAGERQTEHRDSEMGLSSYQITSKTIENLSSTLFPTEPQMSLTPMNDGTNGMSNRNPTKERSSGEGLLFTPNQSVFSTPVQFGGIRSLSKPKLTPRSNKADQLRARAIQEKAKKKLFESTLFL